MLWLPWLPRSPCDEQYYGSVLHIPLRRVKTRGVHEEKSLISDGSLSKKLTVRLLWGNHAHITG